jgi:hypothetical protein
MKMQASSSRPLAHPANRMPVEGVGRIGCGTHRRDRGTVRYEGGAWSGSGGWLTGSQGRARGGWHPRNSARPALKMLWLEVLRDLRSTERDRSRQKFQAVGSIPAASILRIQAISSRRARGGLAPRWMSSRPPSRWRPVPEGPAIRGPHQHVGALHVPVRAARLVRGLQRPCHLRHQPQHLARGGVAPRRPFIQRLALHQLHHHVRRRSNLSASSPSTSRPSCSTQYKVP